MSEYIPKVFRKSNMKTEDYIFRLDLENVMSRLDTVRNQFNFVDDWDLIDALIFEENCLLSHYRYLIKYARNNHIKLEAFPKTYEN